jgi:hypothetical protein
VNCTAEIDRFNQRLAPYRSAAQPGRSNSAANPHGEVSILLPLWATQGTSEVK